MGCAVHQTWLTSILSEIIVLFKGQQNGQPMLRPQTYVKVMDEFLPTVYTVGFLLCKGHGRVFTQGVHCGIFTM